MYLTVSNYQSIKEEYVRITACVHIQEYAYIYIQMYLCLDRGKKQYMWIQ